MQQIAARSQLDFDSATFERVYENRHALSCLLEVLLGVPAVIRAFSRRFPWRILLAQSDLERVIAKRRRSD